VIEINITIKKDQKLQDYSDWSIWTCKPSEFDWEYDQEEHCYVIEGDVTVATPTESVSIKSGDYVVFPKGLKCHWTVHKYIKKHYNFKND